MKTTSLIAAFSLIAAPVLAEPPAGADTTTPTARWYRSLTDQNGYGCCSEADCRPVQANFKNNQWEVFIDRRSFGVYAPDAWMPVPPDRLVEREDNPTGHAVACWGYYHGFYCFTPMIAG